MAAKRNIELKARDLDPAQSLAICTSLEAEDRGVLEQSDTYFGTQNGRLKLREETGGVAHLIGYERPDRLEERESRYRIVETEHPAELKAALSDALGVVVTVEKRRRLFLWDGVRIHLDHVEGLGDFIEFEAVAPSGSDLLREEEQVRALRKAFAIADSDLIDASYCDLVVAAGEPSTSPTTPVELVAELHRRQGEMYAGGSVDSVAELLAEDIVWHVPGTSPIAGDHRGVQRVVAYFEKRRRLADSSMRMHPGEVISTGEGVAQFVEGTAILGGEQVSWQTIGVYRVDRNRVCEVWLVPLALDLFDQIWGRR